MLTKWLLIMQLLRLTLMKENHGLHSSKENTRHISPTSTTVLRISTVQVLLVQSLQLGYGLPQIIKFVDSSKIFMAASHYTQLLVLDTASTTSQPLPWITTGTGQSLHQEQHLWLPLTQPPFVILPHTIRVSTQNVIACLPTLKLHHDVCRLLPTPLHGRLYSLLTEG